ncbi:MAG TPA: hypothetical protein VIM61_00490 [Chthoniobacterales bacterium]
MKIDRLIQKLDELKNSGASDVTFVWDDGYDREEAGAYFVPAGASVFVILGEWGPNLEKTHGDAPERISK